MKRFISVASRSLIAARSSLESGQIAQSLFDVFAVGFCAAFASLLAACVVGSFVILALLIWF